MKVLIVEDERDVGEIFADFVIELGHEPVVVRSAEAALPTLKVTKPDAIILDLHLPGMTGLDFMQLRPVRESGIPIVTVSGVATEVQARECLRLGAVDFLGKPISLERLQAVLDSIEPHALFRRRALSAQQVERRQAPRFAATVPVRVADYNGSEWDTYSVDFSQFGMKVQTVGDIGRGAAARVSFTPPDGGDPIQAVSLLVRQYTDGQAFYFVNLTEGDFQRLAVLTGRLRA